LTRDLSVGGAAVGRQEANKSYGKDLKHGNMMSNFMTKVNTLISSSGKDGEDGKGGGGYRGGGTKYVGGGPGNFFEGAKNWWNRGRNVRVPSENTARWFGRGSLMADDASQMTHSNRAFKTGNTNLKSLRPWKAFLDPEMRGTGPTPAIRQAVERPLRAMKTLGSVRGGFVGLILNELMNPAPLADGTLEGNMSHNSFKLERETLENNLHFIEKSSQLDTNSKENIFTKMEMRGGGVSEPTVINNDQGVDNENIPDQSYIQQSGDSGMDDFYPGAYG